MKFFDENELIAYHFHELTPRRASEVEQLLATDADAGAAFAALEEMLESFRDYGPLPLVNAAVVERNWQAVRASLPYMGARSVKVGWRRGFWRRPLGMGLAGLGAAALVALVVVGMLPSRRAAAPMDSGGAQQALVAPPPGAPSGLPVVGELLGHKVVAERVNGRPGPLTTAPVESDDKDVKDALLVSPVNPAVVVAPSAPDQMPDSSSSVFVPPSPAATFRDGRPQVVSVGHARSSNARRRSEWSPQSMRETDVALGGFGDASTFSAQSFGSEESLTVSSEPAAGARLSFHQQFKRGLGYEVAFGASHSVFTYVDNEVAPYTSSAGSISGRVYEMSLTYEVQGPRSRKISSFANVGGGTVIFQPTGSTAGVSANYQPALAMGLGGEYHATGHWGVRIAYRGMFMVGPNFNYDGTGDIPVASHKMWSSEPTLSVVYHFGAQDKD